VIENGTICLARHWAFRRGFHLETAKGRA